MPVGQKLFTIDDLTVTKDSLTGAEYVAGRDSSGDFKILVSDFLKYTTNNNYERNYLIDGDFNFWSNGDGPFTSNGFFADLYNLDLGLGGTGSVERKDLIDANIEQSYFRISRTSAHTTLISQSINDITLVAGKDISFYIRIKSSTGVDALSFNVIRFNNGSALTTSTSTIEIPGDDTWTWYRLDHSVPTVTPAGSNVFTTFQLNVSAQDGVIFDVSNIKIVDAPPDIPSSVIPEWVKRREEPEAVRKVINQYYTKIVGASSGPNFCPIAYGVGIDANNASFQIPNTQHIDKTPTITLGGVTGAQGLWNMGTGGATSLSGAASISNTYVTSKFITFQITDTGKFAANNCYVFGTDSTASIEISLRR
jgi:hypothetical protein